jgi:hypothetical protein
MEYEFFEKYTSAATLANKAADRALKLFSPRNQTQVQLKEHLTNAIEANKLLLQENSDVKFHLEQLRNSFNKLRD